MKRAIVPRMVAQSPVRRPGRPNTLGDNPIPMNFLLPSDLDDACHRIMDELGLRTKADALRVLARAGAKSFGVLAAG